VLYLVCSILIVCLYLYLQGENDITEMYSAIEAEVPVASDPRTQTNTQFVNDLKRSTRLIIGGQALSHCVNYTTRDLLRYWGPRNPAELTLLIDGCSPVPGCDSDAELFINDMRAANVQLKLTTDAFSV